ncbi:hypothetical protein P8452_02711 [Trifolium repens]|nr:hypothetical protein P8452_02711 [Trifolium repens]
METEKQNNNNEEGRKEEICRRRRIRKEEELNGSTTKSRSYDDIKDITDKKEIWKLAVKVDDFWTNMKSGKEFAEIIFRDLKGDTIHVMIGPDEYKKRKDDVAELMKLKTHTIKNLRVQPNDDKFKLTDHRFKLNFISGTKVDPNEISNVSDSGFKFKKFEKIKALNFREDLLVDVIGAIHEIGSAQTTATSGKGNCFEPILWLKVQVTDRDTQAKFVFWDNIFIDLLGVTAGDLQKTMVQAGVDDPLEYSTLLDEMMGITFAFRVKWQKEFVLCSFLECKDSKVLVDKIRKQLNNGIAITMIEDALSESNLEAQSSTPKQFKLKDSQDDVDFPIVWLHFNFDSF